MIFLHPLLEGFQVLVCASTEIFLKADDVHKDLKSFVQGMKKNHPAIAPSMLYAYAAISEGVPFANGAPNLTVDIPALEEYAKAKQGSHWRQGFQRRGRRWMKIRLHAPGLKARMLGLHGWFSTNILGNRDGEVLDDPESFKTKEESKLGALEYILQPKIYPELYDKFYHKVRINYYPPRRDNKESWDNIDIFGWLGYPMEIKVDFLCRDSILAAPIVLDLSRCFSSPRQTRGHARHSGMAELLFQIADVRPGTLPGARPLHPVHEAEKHSPLDDGRGSHHSPGQ